MGVRVPSPALYILIFFKLKINIDRHDDASLKITASVEPIDYTEKFNETLKKLRKEAVLPGFRPGTVPVNLLKSRFGKQVMWDTISELAMSNILYALREKGIPYVGNPLVDTSSMEQIDINEEKSYEFISYVGYIPDFELDLEDLGEVHRYNIHYDAEDIEMEIRNWQAKLGSAVPVDEINMLDKFYEVALTIKAVDALNNQIPVENPENTPFEEAIANQMDGVFRSWLSIGFNQLFFNKRKGEKYRLTYDDFVNGHGSINPFADPNIPPRTRELFEKNGILMELVEIYEITPHPLNKDLYRKVFGDNTSVKNELEFREEFSEAFDNHISNLSDGRLKYEIDKAILGKQKVTLPLNILMQNFLDEYKRANGNPKEINEDHANFHLNIYLRNIQKMAVFNQIVNDYPEVEVNENTFMAFLKESVRSLYFEDGEESEQLKSSILSAKKDALLHPDIQNETDVEPIEEDEDELMNNSDDMYLEMMVDNLINSKDFDYQQNFNSFAENRILSYLLEHKFTIVETDISFRDFSKLPV